MAYTNPNQFAQDPQRRPPDGWSVKNVLFQRILTQAQRTGCQALVEEIKTHEHDDRTALVLLAAEMEMVARGEIPPEALCADLQHNT